MGDLDLYNPNPDQLAGKEKLISKDDYFKVISKMICSGERPTDKLYDVSVFKRYTLEWIEINEILPKTYNSVISSLFTFINEFEVREYFNLMKSDKAIIREFTMVLLSHINFTQTMEKYQSEVLDAIILALNDEVASVQKSAINFIEGLVLNPVTSYIHMVRDRIIVIINKLVSAYSNSDLKLEISVINRGIVKMVNVFDKFKSDTILVHSQQHMEPYLVKLIIDTKSVQKYQIFQFYIEYVQFSIESLLSIIPIMFSDKIITNNEYSFITPHITKIFNNYSPDEQIEFIRQLLTTVDNDNNIFYTILFLLRTLSNSVPFIPFSLEILKIINRGNSYWTKLNIGPIIQERMDIFIENLNEETIEQLLIIVKSYKDSNLVSWKINLFKSTEIFNRHFKSLYDSLMGISGFVSLNSLIRYSTDIQHYQLYQDYIIDDLCNQLKTDEKSLESLSYITQLVSNSNIECKNTILEKISTQLKSIKIQDYADEFGFKDLIPYIRYLYSIGKSCNSTSIINNAVVYLIFYYQNEPEKFDIKLFVQICKENINSLHSISNPHDMNMISEILNYCGSNFDSSHSLSNSIATQLIFNLIHFHKPEEGSKKFEEYLNRAILGSRENTGILAALKLLNRIHKEGLHVTYQVTITEVLQNKLLLLFKQFSSWLLEYQDYDKFVKNTIKYLMNYHNGQEYMFIQRLLDLYSYEFKSTTIGVFLLILDRLQVLGCTVPQSEFIRVFKFNFVLNHYFYRPNIQKCSTPALLSSVAQHLTKGTLEYLKKEIQDCPTYRHFIEFPTSTNNSPAPELPKYIYDHVMSLIYFDKCIPIQWKFSTLPRVSKYFFQQSCKYSNLVIQATDLPSFCKINLNSKWSLFKEPFNEVSQFKIYAFDQYLQVLESAEVLVLKDITSMKFIHQETQDAIISSLKSLKTLDIHFSYRSSISYLEMLQKIISNVPNKIKVIVNPNGTNSPWNIPVEYILQNPKNVSHLQLIFRRGSEQHYELIQRIKNNKDFTWDFTLDHDYPSGTNGYGLFLGEVRSITTRGWFPSSTHIQFLCNCTNLQELVLLSGYHGFMQIISNCKSLIALTIKEFIYDKLNDLVEALEKSHSIEEISITFASTQYSVISNNLNSIFSNQYFDYSKLFNLKTTNPNIKSITVQYPNPQIA
ncbi:hypothetical protein DLAC_04188 [Tieghemostelium lacteum]|uniref:Uncharacterized protein n=1 Tax=Tieghemostelium lacteum TaxID=361077 RepID=A0A151ZSB5_TIELA|nr:hypothetical protein DLAC_04188 [Tieghemostelium lacteum]|eukprot:KYQ96877.1 hypothetical protein DLAC_04188 [Tieghemostelium lacteum]